MNSKNIVELYTYSDKYLVVFGNTKDYKSHFIAAKGQFRPSFKLVPEKGAGWGFYMSLKNSVEKLVNDINSGVIKPSPDESTQTERKSGSSNTIDDNALVNILKRLEVLEQEVSMLRSVKLNLPASKTIQPTLSVSTNDNEEDEAKEISMSGRMLGKQPNRLLRPASNGTKGPAKATV